MSGEVSRHGVVGAGCDIKKVAFLENYKELGTPHTTLHP